jgi:hypothetical protein
MTDVGAVRTFSGAKRLECAELAPAFGAAMFDDSASKLAALQTLRVTSMPLFPNVSVIEAALPNPADCGLASASSLSSILCRRVRIGAETSWLWEGKCPSPRHARSNLRLEGSLYTPLASGWFSLPHFLR